ncbi:MAG: hypothetical protein OEM00_02975 [Burkholderiaceae bacterium]|nr:hypothetical protein [Burkholderiaceae bacterium]MDH3459937.1 hypothetical protein [Burkholderiaceae bacterium]
MKQRILWVAWTSFLTAGVLEMLVFSAVDPRDLHGFGGVLSGLSPTGVYTLAFFCFWVVSALAPALTLLLATPESSARE